MPYPVNVIPFDQLLNYINTEWITNGVGHITGIIGNDVENSIYNQIVYSPFNSQKVDIITTTGSFQVTKGITFFINQTPSSVTFGDNFWNEWLFINATDNVIPFSSGLGYYNLDFIFQTEIPSRGQIKISKATNGLWVQTASGGASGTLNAQYQKFNTVVGDPSKAVGLYAVTPDDGDTLITIGTAIQPKSENMFYNGVEVKLYPSDDFNYDVAYGLTTTTYNFSQPFQEGLGWDFQFVSKTTFLPASNSLQAVYVVAPTTSNFLVVTELGTFIEAYIRNQNWDDSVITQVGNILNLTAVGGAIAGERYLITYYPPASS